MYFFQLQVCLVLSAVSIVMAVTAVIIYSVDISQNPAVPCDEGTSTSTEIERDCDEKYFAMVSVSLLCEVKC